MFRGTLERWFHCIVSTTTQLTAYTDALAGLPSHADDPLLGIVFFLGMSELHAPLHTARLVYCAYVSAFYLSTNSVQHQRIKHIEIDMHFVRDYVDSGQVRVLHVSSRSQYADIFTKGLPSALFLEFRSSLNVRRPPVSKT
ncbi:ribonuclease H-like domain-containing protein [Tanacetum coccineum]